MICPYCKHDGDKVIDSRSSGDSIRRRRECNDCKKRFTTYEYIEKAVLTVIKQNGSREEFQREKLINALKMACIKRPISTEKIHEISAEIENTLADKFEREVPCAEIGNIAMEKLSIVDQVAYVRFASVYRQFKEIGEFVDEIRQFKKS